MVFFCALDTVLFPDAGHCFANELHLYRFYGQGQLAFKNIFKSFLQFSFGEILLSKAYQII